MPSMKHVMTVALIATAMLTAPLGHADPDPHKPDLVPTSARVAAR